MAHPLQKNFKCWLRSFTSLEVNDSRNGPLIKLMDRLDEEGNSTEIPRQILNSCEEYLQLETDGKDIATVKKKLQSLMAPLVPDYVCIE